MQECELGNEGYKLEQLNASTCGDGLFYHGTWGEDEDNQYYSLVTPTETYYVYRKINVSCRQYYAAKKSYWTGPCNLGQGNCGELWTRVGIPYGESTGEKAADAGRLRFAGKNVAVITWRGGANNVKNQPWHLLQGKEVVLWPDNDQAGLQAMDTVAKLIPSSNVKIVQVSHLPPKADLARSA